MKVKYGSLTTISTSWPSPWKGRQVCLVCLCNLKVFKYSYICKMVGNIRTGEKLPLFVGANAISNLNLEQTGLKPVMVFFLQVLLTQLLVSEWQCYNVSNNINLAHCVRVLVMQGCRQSITPATKCTFFSSNQKLRVYKQKLQYLGAKINDNFCIGFTACNKVLSKRVYSGIF